MYRPLNAMVRTLRGKAGPSEPTWPRTHCRNAGRVVTMGAGCAGMPLKDPFLPAQRQGSNNFGRDHPSPLARRLGAKGENALRLLPPVPWALGVSPRSTEDSRRTFMSFVGPELRTHYSGVAPWSPPDRFSGGEGVSCLLLSIIPFGGFLYSGRG